MPEYSIVIRLIYLTGRRNYMVNWGNVKIKICINYEEMSSIAADLLENQIREKKDSVVCFATGSTPLLMYKKLIEKYNEGRIDFSDVTAFNLDEYYPIDKGNSQSYYHFMNENLFSSINIKEDKRFIPNGQTLDVNDECKIYDEKILEYGGIDFQILGIGRNGHIGFNEPQDFFESATHMVELKQDTIEANARFFDSLDEVPKNAITMGIKSIMMSQKILLLASGVDKAEAIYNAFFGPITPQVPASVLQLHPNIAVLVDRDAFSEVNKRKGLKL